MKMQYVYFEIIKPAKKIILFLCLFVYGFEKSFINTYFYLDDFGT